MSCGAKAALFSAVLLVIAVGAQAACNSTLPVPNGNIKQICPNGALDRTQLINWFYYPNSCIGDDFKSPDDLQQALQNPGAQSAARRQDITRITGAFQSGLAGTANKFQSTGTFTASSYLAGQAPGAVITCTAAAPVANAPVAPAQPPAASAAPPPGSPPPANPEVPEPAPSSQAAAAPPAAPAKLDFDWLNNVRVRDNSADLAVPAKNKDGKPTDAFGASGAATLSFTDTGTTHSLNNTLIAAIGYDFNTKIEHSGPHDDPTAPDFLFDFIPFVAVNRNMTATSGKLSASSVENVSTGLNAAMTTVVYGSNPMENLLSVSAYHLRNDISNAELNAAQIVDTPYINGRLNTYISLPWSDKDSILPILNLRGDFGYYSDRGLKPASSTNFTQIGGQFGFDLDLQSMSSDVTVTQIAMKQFEKLRKDINLFSAAWTWNVMGNKNVGIKASYTNGNLETTAQRSQQWMISLAVKF